MREIKFRAWIQHASWVPKAAMFDNVAIIDGKCHLQMGDYMEDMCEFEDAILMQYTGLNDKNGKEIWEGDVVAKRLNGWRGQVVYHKGQFVVISQSNDMMANLALRSGMYEGNVKVIGNIYENPELLK